MVSVRTDAMVALSVVALVSAAVAGVEQALTVSDSPGAHAGPAGTPTAGTPTARTDPPDGADQEKQRRPHAPCASPVRLCVQLSRSAAWLVAPGGAALGPIPMRQGRPGSPTPRGVFSIAWLDAEPLSSATGAVMPSTIFFAGGSGPGQAELTRTSGGSLRLPGGFGETISHAVTVGDLVEVVP